MKTKEEINYFIGFCQIIEDKFSEKILKRLSNSSKKELSTFKQRLNESLQSRKSCILDDTNLLMGNQIDIALNIIKWLES